MATTMTSRMESANDSEDMPEEALKRGKTSQILIRLLAVIRLLITVAATITILHYTGTDTRPYHNGSQFDHNTEDDRIAQVMCFLHWLAVDAINILVTSLLWAAAFAYKRRCIPIYVLLEIILSVYVLFCSMAFTSDGILVARFAVLIFIHVIVIVVYRYYTYLKSSNRARKGLVHQALVRGV